MTDRLAAIYLCLVCPHLLSQVTECQENTDSPFTRGDADLSGSVDAKDPVRILDFLFNGGSISSCDAADTDDDGAIELEDGILLYHWLYLGGSPPADPFPDPGSDETPDNLDACAGFPAGINPEPAGRYSYTVPNQGLFFSRFQCAGVAPWSERVQQDIFVTTRNERDLAAINSCQNAPSCAVLGSCWHYDQISWRERDSVGWTRRRIEDGLQKVLVNVTTEVQFRVGNHCRDREHQRCIDGTNKLVFDARVGFLFLSIGPVSAGKAVAEIEIPFSLPAGNGDKDCYAELTYKSQRRRIGAGCDWTGSDGRVLTERDYRVILKPVTAHSTRYPQGETFHLDLTGRIDAHHEAQGTPVDECEVWRVYESHVAGIKTSWNRLGRKKISRTEGVVVRVETEIFYGFTR